MLELKIDYFTNNHKKEMAVKQWIQFLSVTDTQKLLSVLSQFEFYLIQTKKSQRAISVPYCHAICVYRESAGSAREGLKCCCSVGPKTQKPQELFQHIHLVRNFQWNEWGTIWEQGVQFSYGKKQATGMKGA